MANKNFVVRRTVCVHGEGGAPSHFVVEGIATWSDDNGEEIISKPETRPATPEEVAQIFGDGHVAQLANIDALTQRMADQAAAKDKDRADALGIANKQYAELKEAAEKLKADAIEKLGAANDAFQKASGRAMMAEQRLAQIVELNKQYDAAIKPLLPPPPANGAAQVGTEPTQ